MVGSGVAGSTIALELSKKDDLEVILMDCDSLSTKFAAHCELTNIFDKTLLDVRTTGYGFGGTSNLWHGVLTWLDHEDFNYFSKYTNRDIERELLDQRHKLREYLGEIDYLFDRDSTHINRESPQFLDSQNLEVKKFIVQSRPTRFRDLLKRRMRKKCRSFRLLENCIALKLTTDESNNVKSLDYARADGSTGQVTADIFVLSAGALESPRVILQSFSEKKSLLNPLTGRGLMDHPFVLIGRIQLPRKILYRQHGFRSLFGDRSKRIGFRFPENDRTPSRLNHSLFIRPTFNLEIETTKAALKELIYGARDYKKILRNLTNKSFFLTAISLFLERFGFGFFTKDFDVSVQLEMMPHDESYVELTGELDGYGRNIPRINRYLPSQTIADLESIQNRIGRLVLGGAMFVRYDLSAAQLFPGSHHSGTCRLGDSDCASVVSADLKYHGVNNLYVCDGSVIPRTGNSNLVLTITCLAIRLAEHLTTELRRK